MELSELQLKSLAHGAISFRREGEYLAPRRFSEAQAASLEFDEFFSVRTRYTAGIFFELVTDAREIGFGYKRVGGSMKDSVDVYVNGKLLNAYLMEKLEREGALKIPLPAGEKTVAIYLPTDVEMHVKNFFVEGDWKIAAKKGDKVLWIGDSITQGVGSFMGGQTFVNLVSRALNYESLNQGIGGYRYLDCAIARLENFQPDKIVVALGTNDEPDGIGERIEAFYRTLNKNFPDIPVLVITPVPRLCDPRREEWMKTISRTIVSVCAKYQETRLVDGTELIPPVLYCFWDNIHPNAWGMELYANNLIAKISNLKF